MEALSYLVAAVFLPLFPASMLFNRMFARAGDTRLRMALLLVWPQVGVFALALGGSQPPAWLIGWGVLTAALYAFRALVLRELNMWTAHMAVSAWALLWPIALASEDGNALALQGLALSVPFALLAWQAGRIEAVFGAAYAGASGGLAHAMPRLATLMTVTVLAAVGTPLFPGFFALLATITRTAPLVPVAAIVILVVWMLWAWAGARITRGFVVGPPCEESRTDISGTVALLAGLVLVALGVAGVGLSGYLV
ncbi:MAG: hypothetical protein H6953_16840 [Chromatiaceae bacterium]|nr:hypothetical protein [Chromatiaceae bacterium]MCP5307105.1 hypothetical protein [Chromatiaceae bacterium]MCP5423267.1 hypothetical protein [Chromatiaceae bacterium]